jgi:hypothetical protein
MVIPLDVFNISSPPILNFRGRKNFNIGEVLALTIGSESYKFIEDIDLI